MSGKRRRNQDDDDVYDDAPEGPNERDDQGPEDDADDDDDVLGGDDDDEDEDELEADLKNGTGEEQGGVADMSKAQNKVWLMKVPEWLYNHWSSCPTDNQEVGSVVIQEGPSTRVLLNLTDSAFDTGYPKEFEVNVLDNNSKFAVYAFSEHNKQVALEGAVEYKFSVDPVQTEDYKRFQREMMEKGIQPVGEMNLTSNPTMREQRSSTFKGGRKTPAQIRKEKDERIAKRNERLPKEHVQKIIFECFHKHKYWNYKGLKEATQQPEVFLKEILSELCVYNRAGKFIALYQLKSEFVANINAPETSNANDDAPGGGIMML